MVGVGVEGGAVVGVMVGILRRQLYRDPGPVEAQLYSFFVGVRIWELWGVAHCLAL